MRSRNKIGKSIPETVVVVVVVVVAVLWGFVDVVVIVDVAVTVSVVAGGVTTELGVDVTLIVARLVTVKAKVFEGTGFFEDFPRSVVHTMRDLVESP